MTNSENNGHINRVFVKGEVVRIFPLFNLKKEKIGLIATIKSGLNYPQVVCFGQCAKIIIADYPIGSRIFLRGNIQSSKRDGGRITTSIFCSEILPINMVADTKFNRFQVQGQVLKWYECSGNRLLVLMKTYTQHLSSFFVNINDYDFRLHSFERNQPIFVEGYVKTSIKDDEETGKRKYYTDFIAEKVVDV